MYALAFVYTFSVCTHAQSVAETQEARRDREKRAGEENAALMNNQGSLN